MTKTHWRKLINPDYLGAYSLDNGKDGYDDVIYTIAELRQEKVVGADGKKEDCTVMHFKERGVKPMIVNTTNMRMMAKIYKTPYLEDWAGRKVQIGAEPVKAFGEVVDALRIRPFVPREAKPAAIRCENCAEAVQGAGKLSADQVAAYAKTKFGQALCVKCATALSEKAKAEAEQADSKQADSAGEENADAASADSNGQ